LSARQSTAFPGHVDEVYRDAEFPCLVCWTGLEVRLSRKGKPYIVCDSCGIQVFFRGKTGINRFRELLETRASIIGKESLTDKALVLYDHIQQLRGRRKKLVERRKLLSTDEALEATIRAVDKEIDRVQGELERLAERPDQDETK
jgi:hypothetical protein